MHYHLEVILPPTQNVEEAIDQIMAPFRAGSENEYGYPNQHTFWDWLQLGGRYAGSKLKALIDKEQMDAFFAKLIERKITVSGVVFGKQTLSPASQATEVNALWCEMFPDCGVAVCPVFDNAPAQIQLDICTAAQMPAGLTAARVIIAREAYRMVDNEPLKLEAEYMISDDIWNGVMHVDTTWDGKVQSAIDAYKAKLESYTEEYKEKHMPQPDWLVVTVDYHS